MSPEGTVEIRANPTSILGCIARERVYSEASGVLQKCRSTAPLGNRDSLDRRGQIVRRKKSSALIFSNFDSNLSQGNSPCDQGSRQFPRPGCVRYNWMAAK